MNRIVLSLVQGPPGAELSSFSCGAEHIGWGCYQTQVRLLTILKPVLERQALIERKGCFIQEASSLEESMKVKVKVKSCLTLCDPMDCSLSGSSIRGILQARILEWVAISFSRGSSQPRDWTRVSLIAGRCFTIWTAREAPSSRERHTYVQKSIPKILFGHAGGSSGKESACQCKKLKRYEFDLREDCLKEKNGNPLQYSCLKNPMDRGAWWATVHGVSQSWKWLSPEHKHMHVFIGKRGKLVAVYRLGRGSEPPSSFTAQTCWLLWCFFRCCLVHTGFSWDNWRRSWGERSSHLIITYSSFLLL